MATLYDDSVLELKTLYYVRNHQSNLAIFMNDQISKISDQYEDFRSKSWKGSAANEYDNIFTQAKSIFTTASTNIEMYNNVLKQLVADTVEAIEEVCKKVEPHFTNNYLGSFDHKAAVNVSSCESVCSYCDTSKDHINNVLDKLEEVKTKSQSSSVSYGDIYDSADSIITELTEYYDEIVSFKKHIYDALGMYDDLDTLAASGLDSAYSVLTGAYNSIINLQPRASDSNPSSPIYRAQEFTRVLMSLPYPGRNDIEAMAYAASEPYRTIFFAFIDQVNVKSNSGGNYFDSSTNTIYYNFKPSLAPLMVSGPDGNYQIYPEWVYGFFHEVGHCIDYHMKEWNFTSYSNGESPYSEQFFSAMRSDVKNTLQRVATDPNIAGKYSADEIAAAIENILARNHINQSSAITRSELAQIDIIDYLKRTLQKEYNNNNYLYENVTDIMGGVTNNAIGIERHHYPNTSKGENYSNWGYWYNVSSGEPTGAQQSEFFSNEFKAGMAGLSTYTSATETYFPEASAVYKQILEDMNEIAQIRLQ